MVIMRTRETYGRRAFRPIGGSAPGSDGSEYVPLARASASV